MRKRQWYFGWLLMAVFCAWFFTGCGEDKKSRETEKPVNASEATVNLHAMFASQMAYHALNQTYANDFQSLGWKPEGDFRYAYFLPDGSVQPAQGGPFEPPAGLKSFVGATGFTLIAVGNIDADPNLDVWMINDAQEVRHVVDDVSF